MIKVIIMAIAAISTAQPVHPSSPTVMFVVLFSTDFMQIDLAVIQFLFGALVLLRA
jgi:hypothetical protein